MAHTATIDGWHFTHDGDALRGTVRITTIAGYPEVTIAGHVLAQFVANAVRDAKIAELEQASAADLLGVEFA